MVGADSLLRARNPSLMVIGEARMVWSCAGRERVGVVWASWGNLGPSHARCGDRCGSELKCKRAAELGNARVWECWELARPCPALTWPPSMQK